MQRLRNVVYILATAAFTSFLTLCSVQPVMSDPSPWSNLKLETAGIQLRYPSEWHVREKTFTDLYRVTLSNVKEFSEENDKSLDNESNFTINLGVNQNPQKLAIHKWFEAKDFYHNATTPPLQVEQVTVGKRPAIRCEVSEIGRNAHYYIQAYKKADVIEIIYPLSQPLFKNIYLEILNSLQLK